MLKKNKAFTLIELVLIIVILGILGAIILPNYIDLSEEALSARTRHDGGLFEQNIHTIRAKWFASGSSSATIDLTPGNTVNTGTTTGWARPVNFTHDSCAALYNSVLSSENPATGPPWIFGNDEYAALNIAGTFCYYIPLRDTTPLRYFRYNYNTGQVLFINS